MRQETEPDDFLAIGPALNMLPANIDTHLTALCPGLPERAGTRKVKPIRILLKQETVSGTGISWAICNSASRSRQDNHASTPPLSFFTGQMHFLPNKPQRHSTEGTSFQHS